MSRRRNKKRLSAKNRNKYVKDLEQDHDFLRKLYRATVAKKKDLEKEILYLDRILHRSNEKAICDDVGKTKEDQTDHN